MYCKSACPLPPWCIEFIYVGVLLGYVDVNGVCTGDLYVLCGSNKMCVEICVYCVVQTKCICHSKTARKNVTKMNLGGGDYWKISWAKCQGCSDPK